VHDGLDKLDVVSHGLKPTPTVTCEPVPPGAPAAPDGPSALPHQLHVARTVPVPVAVKAVSTSKPPLVAPTSRLFPVTFAVPYDVSSLSIQTAMGTPAPTVSPLIVFPLTTILGALPSTPIAWTHPVVLLKPEIVLLEILSPVVPLPRTLATETPYAPLVVLVMFDMTFPTTEMVLLA
jgi:hypothetical protein